MVEPKNNVTNTNPTQMTETDQSNEKNSKKMSDIKNKENAPLGSARILIGGESNALSSYHSLKNGAALKSDQATSKIGSNSTGLSSMQYKQTSEQIDKSQAGVIISQFVPKMPSPSPRSRENYKLTHGPGNHSHRVAHQGNFSNKMSVSSSSKNHPSNMKNY